jgi:hypothetical protein
MRHLWGGGEKEKGKGRKEKEKRGKRVKRKGEFPYLSGGSNRKMTDN